MLAVGGAGPPEHRLVPGTGERHVQETQVLAALFFELHFLVHREAVPVVPHVDGAPVVFGGVVEHGHVGLVGATVPGEGAEDDRELEALAAVDRDHLDRLGIRFQTAGALLVVGVPFGVVDPAPEPGGHGRRTQPLGHARLVEQLRDVPQVGHEALARGSPQHASGYAVRAAHRLEERGHALVTEQRSPLVQRPVEFLPLLLGCRRHRLGIPADEAGEGDERGPVPRCGPFQRLEQAQPLLGGFGREDGPGSTDDRRDADGVQGVAHERRVRVGPHQDGEVPRMQPRALEFLVVATPRDDVRARRQEPRNVRGEVTGDGGARIGCPRLPLPRRQGNQVVGRVQDAKPKRRGLGRADEPGLLVGRGRPDVAVGDVRVPELRAGEEGVIGLEQTLVAAPVHVEGPLRFDLGVGPEIRMDVRTAEGVDGLLGVPDQDQRGPAQAEGVVHDVPLHRVGVLELVDQDHVVALAQPVARRGSPLGVEQRRARRRDRTSS